MPASGVSGLTATSADLNILDGATLTTTELNYVDGVTSGIQSQIDNIDALPSQTGNSGEYLTTDGTNAAWAVVASTPEIATPTNVTPANSAIDILDNATLTGSAFGSLYGFAMSASQWQVSTVSNFASTAISSGDVAGTAVSYTMSVGILAISTVYYWRTRYKNANGAYSEWSTGTSFTTAASFSDYISTPTATPSAFGDALEGGFYAGLIWNELVQSTTSTAIGTGSKAFTVANMASAPLVYSGQSLEVRSRADPDNKMIGVVSNAAGTTLTINITSVGGSGTFTDWSVMAKYRVIVSPKSSGENASVAYKNANTAAPSACATLTEGLKSTLAMVAAGSSTVYPLAHWANNLSIASKTDWYVPARDELELCWRNLKPTTQNNYTTARDDSQTVNYENLGSYGDTSGQMGNNYNSSPAGSTYSATVPAQVYWSSTDYSVTGASGAYWYNTLGGYQFSYGKSSNFQARAVRRSII